MKTPQNCRSPMQRQRFMTTIKNVTEQKKKKKLKSLIGFLSANKTKNYNGGGGRGEEKKEKKNIQKNLQNKLKKK